MTGRYNTDALAALSLGYAVTMPLFVTGIGCMVGIIATTAREQGSGSREPPAIALRGLHWAVAVGTVAGLLCLLAGPILRLVGQAPDLVAGGDGGGGHVRAGRPLPDRLRRRGLLSRRHRPDPARPRGDGGGKRPQRHPQLADDRRQSRLSRRWAPRARRSPRRSRAAPCSRTALLDASLARVRPVARPVPAVGTGRLGGRATRCGGSASPAAPPISSRRSPSPRWRRRRAFSAPRRSRPTRSSTISRRWSSWSALGISVATAVRIGQAAGAGDRARGPLRRARRARRRDGRSSACSGSACSPSRRPSSASTARTPA